MQSPLVDDIVAGLGIMDVGSVELTGDPRPATLSSPLAVAECAVSSVAACLIAAAELSVARRGRRPEITLDTGHVAAAVRSEVWLRDGAGRGLSGFAPLSRLWPTTDGWVRTHANYPWHRAALLAALGVTDGSDADVEARLGDAIGARPALDVEQTVYRGGGLAVAARRVDEWRESEGGNSVAALPLVTIEPLGTDAVTAPVGAAGGLPASGFKVLDLTRVIAGPVGTRMLGALGADVLRIDDPNRPELPLHAIDGVIGKASASLDATTPAGLDTLHRLLDEADVVVTGYRPGALRAFGLDADQLAERHPGTIAVTLSAWGRSGPWGARRGFDSLVQIATGIGWSTSGDGQRPDALPCQLLDHATGYLAAAGALGALATRVRTGQVTHVSLSLARTAQWLLEQGSRAQSERPTAEQAERETAVFRTSLGNGWTSVSPPGQIDREPLAWPHLPPRYAQANPTWASSS